MGEIVAEKHGQTSGNADKIDGGKTDRTSSTSTSAADASTIRTDGGSGGGRTDTAAGGETQKDVSGLALLTTDEKQKYSLADDEEKKRLLRNARRRERYAQEKKQNGQTVKPRKVSAKKKQDETIDVASLNMMVASISAVIASRPNCEHWLLNEQEINSITVPLSKMIAESEQFKNIGQYSNQIALIMACVTVFMPRVIITVQKQQEVKKIERTGQRTDTNVRTDGGAKVTDIRTTKDSNHQSNRQVVGKSTASGKNDTNDLSIYGAPLC